MPVVEQTPGEAAVRVPHVAFQHGADFAQVRLARQPQIDRFAIAAPPEVPVGVQHVGDAARHARGEVAAGLAEHDDAAARHVFAAVVAHALHHGAHPAVAHGEAFAGHAADVGFAVRRPVQGHVADDDVVLRGEGRAGRRIQNDLAAGQALGEIVVGVARQFQRHAGRHEGRETLARGPVEPEMDGVVGQAGAAVAPRDVAADDGAGDAVDVLDRQAGRHPLTALDGRRGEVEQRLPVQRPLQPVVLADPAIAAHLGADVGPVQDVGVVQPARLPVRNGAARLDAVGAPDHVVQRAEAE